MREGETLKTYSDRYWEMLNEIEGEHDDMAISTFKASLPPEHDLRKSLTGKPVTSGKGKAKVIPQERRDFRLDRYNNNRPRKDFAGQSGSANTQAINAVFREPVQQDHRHTIENCRNSWDHLDQLVRERKLKQLLHHSSGRVSQAGSKMWGDASLRLPLGTINIIFAAPGRTGSCPFRVMSVSRSPAEEYSSVSKRARMDIPLVLGFSEEDKIGTIQPHDDALVVTLRIGGYDVKRVMIDQGSAADIMYPDLYKGLGLKSENLAAYSPPLVSFEGRMVIPKGQITIPMQTGADVVEVDFIVVDVVSPYTAIMGRPWLHTLGVISFTLHQKVKYPSGGQVLEIVGSQVATRQCLIAAIQYRAEVETSATANNGL
ncbi:uncharacterized protein LOC115972748 [Quercus lobata]|uniref:uncharacterized protein LOC115972748 n=1 Tax=Quercus lobata TaxID=97700 RepID=UPI001248CC2F|nr:uncharacterized protein LOC115972748 [Quercus lobata]